MNSIFHTLSPDSLISDEVYGAIHPINDDLHSQESAKKSNHNNHYEWTPFGIGDWHVSWSPQETITRPGGTLVSGEEPSIRFHSEFALAIKGWLNRKFETLTLSQKSQYRPFYNLLVKRLMDHVQGLVPPPSVLTERLHQNSARMAFESYFGEGSFLMMSSFSAQYPDYAQVDSLGYVAAEYREKILELRTEHAEFNVEVQNFIVDLEKRRSLDEKGNSFWPHSLWNQSFVKSLWKKSSLWFFDGSAPTTAQSWLSEKSDEEQYQAIQSAIISVQNHYATQWRELYQKGGFHRGLHEAVSPDGDLPTELQSHLPQNFYGADGELMALWIDVLEQEDLPDSEKVVAIDFFRDVFAPEGTHGVMAQMESFRASDLFLQGHYYLSRHGMAAETNEDSFLIQLPRVTFPATLSIVDHGAQILGRSHQLVRSNLQYSQDVMHWRGLPVWDQWKEFLETYYDGHSEMLSLYFSKESWTQASDILVDGMRNHLSLGDMAVRFFDVYYDGKGRIYPSRLNSYASHERLFYNLGQAFGDFWEAQTSENIYPNSGNVENFIESYGPHLHGIFDLLNDLHSDFQNQTDEDSDHDLSLSHHKRAKFKVKEISQSLQDIEKDIQLSSRWETAPLSGWSHWDEFWQSLAPLEEAGVDRTAIWSFFTLDSHAADLVREIRLQLDEGDWDLIEGYGRESFFKKLMAC